MSTLFSPIPLGKLTLKNRIVIAPMCQYSADNGCATEWHMMHIGHLALSGAGLFVIEATAVEPEGRITPADLGLWSDDNERALGEVVKAVRKHSPMPLAIQLAHAGRKASSHVPWEGGKAIPPQAGGWRTFAPSPLPFDPQDEAPIALDAAGLQRIRDGFAAAARRADRLGLNAIEVHGAHGYLLHEFLSPLSNRRDDAYGGSLENRMRFPLEIFDAVRAGFDANKPVGIRVSATDWVEGGWDLEQTVVFAQELRKRGCDFIDVSSGGLSPLQHIPLGPGYQVPFAERIRQAAGMPTVAVGLITEAEHAEEILSAGKADMIALARGMLYNPRWPWHAAARMGAEVDAPPQYWRSQPRELKHLFSQSTLPRP
ncbi:NADH:flavin oxidoreductase/NADH oxidase [Herbaspirillum sp. HC18]|nr:NADH:flavin oxidoreductase/NADH oxidase [Herbaspirillum sp. HC18]